MSIGEFLYRQCSSRPLSFVRIAVGVAAIIQAFQSRDILGRWLLPETVRAQDVWFIPELGPTGVSVYIALWIVAATAFTIGAWFPASGMILTAIISYKLILDQGLFSNHEYLLALLTMLITLAGGSAWMSIDAWLGSGGKFVNYWGVWLIQVQISAMYFFAASAKVLSPDFMSGEVLAKFLALPPVLKYDWLNLSLSYVAIVGEFGLAIGLWIRRLQPYCVLFGVFFHSLIVLFIAAYRTDLIIFGIITVAPYLLFLNLEPNSRVVIWDDSCVFCARCIGVFQKLDWFSTCNFVGASNRTVLEHYRVPTTEAEEAIQLVDSHGRLSGIKAIGVIMTGLPAIFFLGGLVSFPGIRGLADKAYKHVAKRRQCISQICSPAVRQR